MSNFRYRLMQVLLFIAVIFLIVILAWMSISAPCSMWSFSKAEDIPARCLSEFTGK